MADGYVGLLPDNTGKKVDTAELTRNTDATVVERQRVVIADNTNVNAFLDIDSFIREQRQMQEIATLQTVENAANCNIKRASERGYLTDRRGHS
jgi:hypothetical protein